MELRYKPDFGEVLARFEAWWHCEIIDRPLVTVPPVRSGSGRSLPEKAHASHRRRWMDAEYAVARRYQRDEVEQFLRRMEAWAAGKRT